MYIYMRRCLNDRLYEQLVEGQAMRFLFLDPSSCSGTQSKDNFPSAVEYVQSYFRNVIDSSDIIFLPYIERLAYNI